MKQIVAVLCLLATLSVSIQMVQSQVTKSIKQTCMNETGTTLEDFRAFRRIGKIPSLRVLCYVACIYREYDVWTPENKMNMTNFKKIFNKLRIYNPEMYDVVMELSEKCNEQVKPDPDVCITVNRTLNCLQQQEAKKFKSVVTVDIQQACMNETGNTAEDMEAYKKPGAIRTRGLLCYVACVYKKLDVWTSGNRLNIENFKKLLARLKVTNSLMYNKIIKFTKACNGEENLDPDVCIAVNQTLNCMAEEEAKFGTNLVLE